MALFAEISLHSPDRTEENYEKKYSYSSVSQKFDALLLETNKNTYFKKILSAISHRHVLAKLFYRNEECLA